MQKFHVTYTNVLILDVDPL